MAQNGLLRAHVPLINYSLTHSLTHCPDFTNKYFTTSASIEEVVKETDVKNIIDFIKEMHFYHHV